MHPLSSPPQTAGANAISASALTRRFGDFTAVDHIDLRIAYGQIFGLLRPNGAGKSTTVKMLTTLIEPTSGPALVAGFDVMKSPAEVRRRIGYVPQMLSADGGLTGRENLTLSAKLYGMRRADCNTCIVKTRERFMGIGQVLSMPLFFASSAIYPIAMMPRWLQAVAVANPLTYLVDALRGIMIQGGQSMHPFYVDLAVMAIIFVILATIASKLYPTLVR